MVACTLSITVLLTQNLHTTNNQFADQCTLFDVFFLTEVVAPLIVGTQNQFKFSHITAGATAMGKVPFNLNFK